MERRGLRAPGTTDAGARRWLRGGAQGAAAAGGAQGVAELAAPARAAVARRWRRQQRGDDGGVGAAATSAQQRQQRGERRESVVGPIGGMNRRMSTTRLRKAQTHSQRSSPLCVKRTGAHPLCAQGERASLADRGALVDNVPITVVGPTYEFWWGPRHVRSWWSAVAPPMRAFSGERVNT
ncbi:hypothetical protein Scep_019635 [Stephania cephalantha]|uniref:Uncharacterized protein n=1 Tax=Stephania cephalantha TaxID=152367 RepID=A0AAP0IB15_9MAGN